MNTKLHAMIERARKRTAFLLAPPALPAPIKESIHVNGLIRVREVPFETIEEWRKWWLGEFDDKGQMIRPPRMSEREKERYTTAAQSNILVAGGITQLLNYIGSTNGNSVGFAQYFALGNIAVSEITSADTSVAGEYFRAAPSMASISGVQQDLSMFTGTTQAVAQIYNAGLFGNGASGTLGSGTLMTHSPLIYNKVNGVAVTFDYLLSYT